MISVTIEYKPFLFLRRLKRIEAEFPSHYRELTPEQLCLVSAIHNATVTEEKILQIFLSIKRKIAQGLSAWQRFNILRNMSFLNELEACDRFIIPELGQYKAPEARLADVTFGQFIFADSYFIGFQQGRKEDLNRFIACYYLNDRFDEKLIEQNALIIREFDKNTRDAIALNYVLIREWMAKRYPYVFQKADEGDVKKPTAKAKPAEWVKVFDNIVGDDIVNADRIAATELSTMMRYLNRKTKEYYKNGK